MLNDVRHISGKHLIANGCSFFNSRILHVTCTDDFTKVFKGFTDKCRFFNSSNQIVLICGLWGLLGELCKKENLASEEAFLLFMKFEVFG